MSLPRCRLERGRRLALDPLRDATRGAAPRLATEVALLDDGERLHVDVTAHDPHPWATLDRRDADLWTEEVIEVFLAPGSGIPTAYFEIEVNPLGAVFDARVESPHGDRRGLVADRSWDCPGLATRVIVDAPGGVWRAAIEIPWRSVDGGTAASEWRLNVYRIDRPPRGEAEFSAWSPTLVEPADFHRPARFGFLDRVV